MAMAQRNMSEIEENVVESLEAGGPLMISKLEVWVVWTVRVKQ